VAHYAQNDPRGEYVLVMAGAPAAADADGEITLEQAVAHAQSLLDGGMALSAAAKTAAQGTPFSKSEIYKALLQAQQNDDETDE
jgi:16S rRNA (cytidine1402-2'-O)-methyltransferase